MPFTLPELPYAYDALDPYMSAETLEFHHDKHHAAYASKAADLITGSGLEGKSLEDIVYASFQDPSKSALFNNAGQHWNHLQFWQSMKPKGGGVPPGKIMAKIDEDFGSFEAFRGKFIEAGIGQFGSGWCWLAMDPQTGRLEIMKTLNAESPIAHGKTPLLTCDVWEHSYYLDYRNARPKYLEAFVDHLVNWEYVEELLARGPIKF